MKKKIYFLSAILVALLLIPNLVVNAASYNYDFFKNPVYSSEGLAYKDTVYFSDTILNSTYDVNTNPLIVRKQKNTYIDLSNIFVDDATSKIYILDGAATDGGKTPIKVKTSAGEEVANISKNSAVYILNNEFKLEFSFDVLRISDDVKDTLLSYYGLPLIDENGNPTDGSMFTKAQIESTKTIEQPDRRCPFFLADIEGSGVYENVAVCYGAEGIFVSGKYIYLADTFNSRIFRINTMYNDIQDNYVVDEVFLTPNDITFYQIAIKEDQSTKSVFLPSKIAVDGDGRVYTIASSTYQGIVEYKPNGEFNRFIGKNLVSKRSWWTFLLTEEQYNKLALNLPSQFTNLVIDDRNLLYATARPDQAATTATEMIKLINTSGKDVLKRNGYVTPDGDINYSKYVKPAVTGSSIFVAIDINKSRIYSAVDQTRGRIFTYDDEGNLLYISGEQGSLSNTLKNPVALSYFTKGEEEYVLVLDKGSKSMLVYETTEFGKIVNAATDLYLNNKIAEAQTKWEQVVKMNSNYELGYVGIGKSILRDANKTSDKDEQLAKYKQAMEMFELGHNKQYYSDAFKQYRNIILKDNFSIIMTGFVVVLVAGVTLAILNKKHRNDVARAAREAVENRE